MGDASTISTTISELRSQVARKELSTELTTAAGGGDDLFAAAGELAPLPTDPAVAALLRGAGLRRGAVYAVSGSTSLLFRLIAPATAEGLWCGLVGLPDLGFEAAAQAGVALDRLVVVPDPGTRWLGVVSTLADALPLVVVRPMGVPSPGVVGRLAARLRAQGGTLLVVGPAQRPWPQTAATLSVEQHRWQGLGAGHGYLRDHEITVTVTERSGVRRSGVLDT